MQENDQSRRAGRPSLLSEQAPASDSGSILSKLDGGAGASRSGGASGGVGRMAGIAAAVALTGGAIGWGISSVDTPAPELPPVAAVAPPPQAPAAPSLPPSAAQVVTAPTVAPAGGSDVSAATILDEVPTKAEPGAKSLAAALEGPPSKHAPGAKDELVALLDKPPVAPAPAKAQDAPARAAQASLPAKHKTEPVKLAKSEKPATKSKTEKSTSNKDKTARDKLAKEKSAKDKARNVAAEKSKPAARKEKAPVDGDVALLAALLAHTKKAPAHAKPITEYQKCSTLDSVAAADKCRERLCARGAKAPAECKPPRVAKAAS